MKRQLKSSNNYFIAEYFRRSVFTLFLVFSIFSVCFSQSAAKDIDPEQAYTRTINQRAGKIVATLNITNTSKATRITNIIANQYRQLNAIQTLRDSKISALKTKSINNKEVLNVQIKTFEDSASAQVSRLHAAYIIALSKELKPSQVDQVKNGMTYGVVPITYNGYLAMIPTLTDKQKEQIMTWLVEAREHAMDAETADKKHAWFGKYKGRINNYLSAAGYNLKKEGAEWEKRTRVTEAAAKN